MKIQISLSASPKYNAKNILKMLCTLSDPDFVDGEASLEALSDTLLSIKPKKLDKSQKASCLTGLKGMERKFGQLSSGLPEELLAKLQSKPVSKFLGNSKVAEYIDYYGITMTPRHESYDEAKKAVKSKEPVVLKMLEAALA